MTKEINNKLKQISHCLKPYNPEKVILFGSYAWGKPTKDSDIDLLIIKSTNEEWFRRIPKARSYLYKIDNAFDILIYTPKEIKQSVNENKNLFIEDILRNGIVIFSKPKSKLNIPLPKRPLNILH